MHSQSLTIPISVKEKTNLASDKASNIFPQVVNRYARKSESSDNIGFSVLIKGRIDESAIDLAFRLLTKKNSAFRYNFMFNGSEWRPILRKEENNHIIEFIDKSDSEARTDFNYLQYTEKAFDIENDFLLRITIIKYNHSEFVVLATSHKMVCDLYSLEILLKQFCDIYPHLLAGRKVLVSEDSKAYSEKKILFSKKYKENKFIESYEPIGKYFLDRDSGTELLEKERIFANYPFRLGEEIDNLLNSKAEMFSSTIYMLILAAYKVTLFLKTGSEEIPVIAPFVDRNIDIDPVLIGSFKYNLLCETRIDDSMTLLEVMNNVKKSVLGMVGFHGQSLPTYVNDSAVLNKHVAFSWDVTADQLTSDGIFVIVDPGNSQKYDPIVAEPFFIKQEDSPFTVNLSFKRDKNGQLFGSFIYDVNKISLKKIENTYVQFYKILFVLLSNHDLTLSELKNIYMVDTLLTLKRGTMKENANLDIERNLRKAAIQY